MHVKSEQPVGGCTTVYFTVELSPGLKNLFKNSTMVPDASNLVLSNLWVKFNVVYTPFLIFSLFAIMCILQNEKSEIIPRGVCTTTNLNHTLQFLWLLSNFHTLYTVWHGPTHSTFFFLDQQQRSSKESIPEGLSLRQSVLPFCHLDLRIN